MTSALRAAEVVDEVLQDEGLPGLRDAEWQVIAAACATPGRVSVARLVARVLAAREPSPPRRVEVHADHWRWQALSDIAAIDAAAREDVRAFRTAALPDGLLEDGDGQPIHDWIIARRNDGRPGPWVDGRTLSYADSTAANARHTRYRAGGLLERLAQLSGRLAHVYGWSPDQAVAFVLCGAVPYVSGASMGFHVNSERPGLADRVTLTVHPMLPASEVYDLYVEARTWYAEHRPMLARQTPVREHAARLAVFVFRAFTDTDLPGELGSRAAQWAALQRLRPDLPAAWHADADYRRLLAAGQAPTYRRARDWWRDAKAAVEALVFLRPVGQPGRRRGPNAARRQ